MAWAVAVAGDVVASAGWAGAGEVMDVAASALGAMEDMDSLTSTEILPWKPNIRGRKVMNSN